jgi:hypothetical protein
VNAQKTMVKVTKQNDKDLLQCEECCFHYVSRDWADKCEEWCKEYHSCNLEITEHAEENKKEL